MDANGDYSRTDSVRYPWIPDKAKAEARMLDDVEWCNSIKGAYVFPQTYGLIEETFEPIVLDGLLQYVEANESEIAVGDINFTELIGKLLDDHEGNHIRLTIEFLG